jgi:sortase A
VLRDAFAMLAVTGTLLLLDVAVTLLWQEPLTAGIALIRRAEIDQRLLTQPLSPIDRRALGAIATARRRIAFLALREQRAARTGDAVGRISIPRISLSMQVVQGTDELSLEKGPGHYPSTPLPGRGQTVAIAGHRTTYLEPFRHIDELARGERIVLRMPYGAFTYVVQSHRIVSPTAWWITRNVGYERLVLSACNPLYSAAQRYVVFARLRSVTPLGAARRPVASR